MEFQFTLLVIPLILSAAITAILAVISARNWKSAVAYPFSLLMAAATIWSLGSVLQLMSADLETNYYATIIEYPGIVTVPVAWFLIVLHYTGGDRYVTRKTLPFFFFIPAVSVLLVITNPLHHLYYTGFSPFESDNMTFWVFSYGPLFWIHIGYSYALSILGLVLVVSRLMSARAVYRRQMILLFLACAIPVAANILYVFSFGPVPGLDLTPLMFTLSGLIVAFGIVRYRLFSLMPVACSRIFRTMSDGVLVTDRESLVIEINPAAERILRVPVKAALVRPVEEILPGTDRLIAACSSANEPVHDEITIRSGGSVEYYDAACSPLDPITEEGVGHLLILRNITERKRAEMALDEANKKLNLLASITRHDILNQITALNCYLDLNAGIAGSSEEEACIEKEKQIIAVIQEQIGFTKEYQNLGVELPRWQNLRDTLSRAVPQLDLKSIRLEIRVGQYEVYADPMLERVFYNLLDNSLRYGETLTAITIATEKRGDDLVVSCSDDGIGISTEDKKKLFTKGFGRHTGLGLFLSKEILAITGISITETGVPGNGARFEIRVPAGSYRQSDMKKPVRK